MYTGERQAARLRVRYLQAMLKQDVGFFDTDAKSGDIVSSISSDTLLVQDALSEKVPAQNSSWMMATDTIFCLNSWSWICYAQDCSSDSQLGDCGADGQLHSLHCHVHHRFRDRLLVALEACARHFSRRAGHRHSWWNVRLRTYGSDFQEPASLRRGRGHCRAGARTISRLELSF